MTERKFYRSVVQVEILSEEPIKECLSAEEIGEMITDGPCSGDMTMTTLNEEMTGEQAAQALIRQRSDPGFFNLTNAGDDADTGE